MGNRKASAKPRQRSPSGWWVAILIERFEFYDEDKKNPRRRCLVYENTVLLKACDAEVAYRKAVRLGKLSESCECIDEKSRRKGKWKFEGLSDLLPVYEDIEDGAEILWREHRNISVATAKAAVSKKRDLGAFRKRRA